LSDQKLVPIWMALGSICAGITVIHVANLFMGIGGHSYLLYGLCTWFWVSSVDFLNSKFFLFVKNINLRFSIAWLIPIIILLIMGLFHFTISVVILSFCALLDLIFRLALELPNNLFRIIKSLVSGFLLALTMLMIIVVHDYPWLDALAPAGIGYVDTFRDAATIMSWHNYSIISHGVHGLLFEPYHSLSALLFSPLITEEFSVFSVFTVLSTIVVPTLIIYAISTIIKLAPAERISKNWPILLILFIFTFSYFPEVSNQRSLMAATLLMIGAIPLFATLTFSANSRHLSVALILALLLPLITFARAFHGIILAVFSLKFLINKFMSIQFILFSGLIASLSIFIFFFGATDRAQSNFFEGLWFFLVLGENWLINPWILISIPILIFFKEQRKNKNMKFLTLLKDTYYGPIIYVCLITLVLMFRSANLSDAIYTAVPAFMLLFFLLILAPEKLLENHFPLEKYQYGLGSKISLCTIGLLLISKLYLVTFNERLQEVQFDKQQIISSINNSIDRPGATISQTDINTCAVGLTRKMCELRVQKLGAHNIIEIANSTTTAKLAASAKRHAKTVNGVTGVYVAPDHYYWRVPYYHRKSIPSTYIMAITGLPLVFGAQPGYKDLAYSIMTAHEAGGTLLPIQDIGGIDLFCNSLLQIDVDNVVIFQADDYEGKLVICNKNGKSKNS
jgi:hypothetical protein